MSEIPENIPNELDVVSPTENEKEKETPISLKRPASEIEVEQVIKRPAPETKEQEKPQEETSPPTTTIPSELLDDTRDDLSVSTETTRSRTLSTCSSISPTNIPVDSTLLAWATNQEPSDAMETTPLVASVGPTAGVRGSLRDALSGSEHLTLLSVFMCRTDRAKFLAYPDSMWLEMGNNYDLGIPLCADCHELNKALFRALCLQ